MRYERLNDGAERTFVVVFDRGDEVMEGLLSFAIAERLEAARLTAIGALSDATVGWFDVDAQQYVETFIREQVEVLSLIGNIALLEGQPKIHAHAVLSRRDASACGGHVLAAHVNPTLEVMATESPQHLVREHDPALGIALLRV